MTPSHKKIQRSRQEGKSSPIQPLSCDRPVQTVDDIILLLLEESQETSSKEEYNDKKRGPSKSGLAFPLAAGNAGTAVIATTATSGFNWKPLCNFGAEGLGGFGASGLTNLDPSLILSLGIRKMF